MSCSGWVSFAVEGPWRSDHPAADHVPERVAHDGICHHGPIRFPFAPVIANSAENQQIEKVGEIGELHKLVQRRVREALEPQGWIHSGEPGIKRNQLRIMPAGVNEMSERPHLLKAEQKEKMRIPVAPEMPEAVRARTGEITAACGAGREARLDVTESQDER